MITRSLHIIVPYLYFLLFYVHDYGGTHLALAAALLCLQQFRDLLYSSQMDIGNWCMKMSLTFMGEHSGHAL